MKPWAYFAPASPPDVRQGFALPVGAKRKWSGLRPWSGALPPGARARGPGRGAEPPSFLLRFRQGKALPHIRRRSRGERYAGSLISITCDFQDGISPQPAKPECENRPDLFVFEQSPYIFAELGGVLVTV